MEPKLSKPTGGAYRHSVVSSEHTDELSSFQSTEPNTLHKVPFFKSLLVTKAANVQPVLGKRMENLQSQVSAVLLL